MFKIGDKVAMATATRDVIHVGAKGVVQYIHEEGLYRIVVDFGDTASRYGRRIGRGWCMNENELVKETSVNE